MVVPFDHGPQREGRRPRVLGNCAQTLPALLLAVAVRGDVTLRFPALKPFHHRDQRGVQTLSGRRPRGRRCEAGAGRRSTGSSVVRNIGLTIGVFGVLVGLFIWSRRRPAPTKAADSLNVPEQLTPFSVVAFLSRVQREYASRLDDTSRAALGNDFRQIESAFFSGQPSAGAPNLEAVARKWMQTVG